jgi:carbonic anhydrase
MNPSQFAPNIPELVDNNRRYSAEFSHQDLSLRPRRRMAVVTCMDSRMEIFEILGLAHGDAHIIRNAGGSVTDDVIRSLALSQRMLSTREIVLIQHTDCGLHKLNEDQFKAEIEAETGMRPWWALESFSDPYLNVRQSINRLRHSPFVFHKEHVSGFVYDVQTGALSEVLAE